MKKLSTKQIVTAGVCLAIMILSQFLKNLSVYITGPIVNTCLIIATLSLGPVVGVILSIIAPVTSFFITGSPLMQAIPLIIPAVMMGNIIICLATYVCAKKIKNFAGLPVGLVLGSVLKALFMGGVISNCLLVYIPTMLPEKAIAAAKVTFSVTQLITSLIGSVLAYIIWMSAGKALMNSEN